MIGWSQEAFRRRVIVKALSAKLNQLEADLEQSIQSNAKEKFDESSLDSRLGQISHKIFRLNDKMYIHSKFFKRQKQRHPEATSKEVRKMLLQHGNGTKIERKFFKTAFALQKDLVKQRSRGLKRKSKR